MKTLLAITLLLAGIQAKADDHSDTSVSTMLTASQSLTTITVNDEGEHLLADTHGNTLYIFDLDKGSKSVCNATCAEVWPPYLLTDEEAKTLSAPYGAVIRDNKKIQLTYEGHPVYTYALDRGVAAEAGDGIGGVWHYIEIEQ